MGHFVCFSRPCLTGALVGNLSSGSFKFSLQRSHHGGGGIFPFPFSPASESVPLPTILLTRLRGFDCRPLCQAVWSVKDMDHDSGAGHAGINAGAQHAGHAVRLCNRYVTRTLCHRHEAGHRTCNQCVICRWYDQCDKWRKCCLCKWCGWCKQCKRCSKSKPPGVAGRPAVALRLIHMICRLCHHPNSLQ